MSFFTIIEIFCVALENFLMLNSFIVHTRKYVEPTSITLKKSSKQWLTLMAVTLFSHFPHYHRLMKMKANNRHNIFCALALRLHQGSANAKQLMTTVLLLLLGAFLPATHQPAGTFVISYMPYLTRSCCCPFDENQCKNNKHSNVPYNARLFS